MTVAIRPVLKSMMRNCSGPILVAFQIAVALAVLVNAVYMAEQRVEKMARPTGIDDRDLFGLRSVGFTPRFNSDASLREDLAYIRSVPGVIAATSISAVPLSQNGNVSDVCTRPHPSLCRLSATFYDVDDQALNTLGVRLLAGRGFRADEILPPIASSADPLQAISKILVTRSLARVLFPGKNALGLTIYDDADRPVTIIGVITDMAGTGYSSSYVGYNSVVLLPRLAPGRYLVRTAPGRRDALMRTIEDHLSASNPDRVIQNVRSVEFYKNLLYMADRNMAIFLLTVTTLLVAITCIGVFGLVTFNVARRTKQIGTRRAIGACRADIIRYFLVENALITTAGVVIGCALALGAGYWLSVRLELPRLDLYYLVGGVVLLWGISQLAAWHPARRAATVSPSVATRTV